MRALGGKPPQKQRGVLVAAVLRPEQGEHCELEVVGLALEQPADLLELRVGETERAMQRQAGVLRAGRLP